MLDIEFHTAKGLWNIIPTFSIKLAAREIRRASGGLRFKKHCAMSSAWPEVELWFSPLLLAPIVQILNRWFGSALKKKLTENSASLTGCNRLTCKGDGKLFRHEDRVNPTSSDDKDEIFRNHRNFPTVFFFPAKEFSENFPSSFRRMNHQKQHERDSIPRPSGSQSTTLPLRHTPFCVKQ
jgi:hypothetical protein